MSRKHRRALGRLFRRPEAQPQPDPEVVALRARLEELEAKHDALPGVVEGRKDWTVLVDGNRVDLKALPAIEWVRSQQELPAFLFAFTTDRLANDGGGLSEEVLEKIVDLAKRWIRISAVNPEGVNLDRLTLPEAEHAVAQIASLNGVTDSLRAWFRQRLTGVAVGAPSSAGVRSPAQRPDGGHLN